MQVSIEVTRRCPLECLHCYNNLPMGDLDARRREMSKEEHFQLLDELAQMGTFWLLYTGGEIFARKDFLEIYTYRSEEHTSELQSLTNLVCRLLLEKKR